MSSVMQQLGFDYESLAPEVRTDVQESARRIHELERRTSESIIEIGQQLIRVKQRLPHGEFVPWLDTEFGWSRMTATRFMSVADSFKSNNLLHIGNFQPSALYALASNNVPQDIRDDFAQAAEAGHKVTHSQVQEVIQDRRNPEPQNIIEVDADTGEILSDEPEPLAPLRSPAPAYAPQSAPPVSTPHVSHNSGENEWYTPSEYLEAAREVLGTIDLDPASSDIANERVKASRYFTKEDNGLAQEWHGNVWMNPPYAQPLMGMFADKVVAEFDAGRIDSAIVLVNNATETKWFQTMMQAATAVCFNTGRIRYLTPSGKPANSPLQGQAFLYFGGDDNGFARVFRQFGFVLGVL